MRLDMHSRREILKANVEEYQRASKKGRKDLLDRFVPVTGLNRSYLATALENYGKKVTGDRTGRNGPKESAAAGGPGSTGKGL